MRNHISSFEGLAKTFRFIILVNYGLTYHLMSDVIVIINKGSPEKDAVLSSCGSLVINDISL